MFCSKCGNEIADQEVRFCPKCGNGMTTQLEMTLGSVQRKISAVSAGQKYPVLRLISVIYKVAAVVIGIFGIISSLGSCASMASYGMFAGHMMFLGGAMFLGSIALAISLWALGEGIMVFLDMEETLRKIADKE